MRISPIVVAFAAVVALGLPAGAVAQTRGRDTHSPQRQQQFQRQFEQQRRDNWQRNQDQMREDGWRSQQDWQQRRNLQQQDQLRRDQQWKPRP